ncbi:MAG TPA: hypothetical protein VMB26_03190, partial [Candidatus Binataceae bacterium]|nr:hypothetical protein [Candidatus Binataceae bacterium]
MLSGANCRTNGAASWPLRYGAIPVSVRAFAVVAVALNLFFNSLALAQNSATNSSGTESEYDRGYDAGYQAGLRAALATKTGGRSAASAQATAAKNAPEAPQSSSAIFAKSAAVSSIDPPSPSPDNPTAAKIKSLWEQMTTHDENDQDTFFHHSQTSPFWLSAQANF